MNSVNSILYLNLTIALLLALLIFSLVKREKSEALKLFLFWAMVIPVIFTTFFLSATTIIDNERSASRGPVHWHADFQIYSCGELIKLKRPAGLSNRIGTPLLHEHGDNRIHVEGTVAELKKIALGKFFESIGGKLTNSFLLVPTDQGNLLMQNNMSCPDLPTGEVNGSKSILQIFAYKTNEKNKTIRQEKLTDLPNYQITQSGRIPPGDCLIIEFGQPKDHTDHICTFYEIAINKGEYNYSPPREEGLGEVKISN